MNKKYMFNELNYELIEDYKNGFEHEAANEKITDYFNDYDYIVGDWAYGKLRLKGFCDKKNKLFSEINNYDKVKEYIKNNCAYECKYFILKKLDIK